MAIQDEPTPLVPILLLDAFCFERAAEKPIRCVVVGCVGGELRLVPESHLHRLPKLLLESWWRIQDRPLRTVGATDLALCVMDAFSASSQGWRVWLRTMIHVRVTDNEVTLEPIHRRGETVVSAAIAKVSVAQSASDAFDNPRAEDEITHHWWLPTATPSETRAGQGLLLVYTLPDPAVFEGADNRAVQRRLEMDLGVGATVADPLAEALETFLAGKTSLEPEVVRARSPAFREAESPLPAPRAAPTLGTIRPPGSYTSPGPSTGTQTPGTTGGSGRDWSSDFSAPNAPKRVSQGGWWRDFAPGAVGVGDLSKPRRTAALLSQDYANDFE